ncbi:unnamed protein product, partial [Iphiclides podalirius]
MLYLLSIFVMAANAAFDNEIHSKYLTLPRIEFVEYFNSLNLTWTARHYGEDQRTHRPCAYIDRNATYPTVRHDVSSLSLPDSFDARQQWSQCSSISMIYNQENCGSCWTFGTAGTASDRTCIHSNVDVQLSEQDLGCCTKCYRQTACDGGQPPLAFQFWIDSGLVTSDCLPYDINALASNTACTKTCANGNDYNSDKHYGGRVYSVSSEEDQIMAELYNNGPIETSFYVFSDFNDYSQGVYVHTYGEKRGLHSVRVIGYGEESGEKYWLVANSWGTDRGENGLYKIKRFQPELEFEDNLLTAMPKGY